MIIGTKAVDETRFQFRDTHVNQNALGNNSIPGIDVSSSFNSGGSPFIANYNQDKAFELHNILTFTQGTHAVKIGARARQEDETSYSTSNYNGSYSFSLNPALIPNCLAAYANPTSLDLYRQTQILLSQGQSISAIEGQGCGPTQFTQGGRYSAAVCSAVRSRRFLCRMTGASARNLTISLGVRYETQNNIHDHHDFAPRVAVAWAPGAKKNVASKTVIRSGFGIFYDRFDEGKRFCRRCATTASPSRVTL